MNKRALNRVLRRLNQILNFDNKLTIDNSFFRYTPISHSLTRDFVEQAAMKNSSWTEFDLFKEVLSPLIWENSTNFNALFIIHDLMARQASIDGKQEAYELHKQAIYYLALRSLEGAKGSGAKEYYFYISGHRNCCGLCSTLDKKAYAADGFLENPPIPIPGCSREDHLCICIPTAISKSTLLRFIETGRLKGMIDNDP